MSRDRLFRVIAAPYPIWLVSGVEDTTDEVGADLVVAYELDADRPQGDEDASWLGAPLVIYRDSDAMILGKPSSPALGYLLEPPTEANLEPFRIQWAEEQAAP